MHKILLINDFFFNNWVCVGKQRERTENNGDDSVTMTVVSLFVMSLL